MTPGRHVDDTRPPDGPARTEHAAGERRGATDPSTANRTGAVLPNRSKDDVDAAWGDAHDGRDDDERFLREVPPHW